MDRKMMDYLPPVLRKVRDFVCLMEQYQGAFSALWQLAKETEDDLYLQTAGERGLSRWERILEILPREGASLEERRQVIFSRIGQTTPYTWSAFLSFLTAITGTEEAYSASLRELTLEVRLFPKWRGFAEAVWEMMQWVVPANIEMRLIRVYKTHGALRARRHREMGVYTHQQLREEVEKD